ncbi:hypothetical protein JYT26_02360 [Beggiatoa alba]|nr:hypothetical protein [Beggiatoa alba]
MERKCERRNINDFSIRAGAWLLTVGVVTGLMACGAPGGGNNTPEVIPLQTLVVNVLSTLVSPSYTLNGVEFDVSEYNDGNFVLRSTTSSDDFAVLGSSHDASPAAVRVVQSTYDVLYRHETGEGVPQNVDSPVQTGVAFNSDVALPIAVTAWQVTPSFTHNGLAFPLSEYDEGVFYLQPSAGGERIFLGNSHSASPDPVQVMPGTYDVIYSLETGGDLVPNNQGVVVDTVVVDTNGALNVDVASVRFQFDARLDMGAFPASQYQKALFFLRNASTGDRVALGASFDLPITLSVVEGIYDIIYQHVQGDALPVNTDAILVSNIVIDDANPSQTIDIITVAITPFFILDGNAFPEDEYNDANFYLRGVNNPNDEMFIGASDVAANVVRVISSDLDIDLGAGVVTLGAYDVLYRHKSGAAVPQNVNAVVSTGITLNSDVSPFNVSVASVDVTGRFTLNRRNFPADASDSVQFLLRGDDVNDVFLFGYSDISNEPVKLISIPGADGYQTYDVIIDHLAGDAVPQNEMHIVDFNEVLNVDGVYGINITAWRIDPSFTLDSLAFAASIYQSATFYLRDTTTNKRIFLGHSYKDNNPVVVVRESYDIIYEHLNGDQTPQNTNSVLRVLDL